MKKPAGGTATRVLEKACLSPVVADGFDGTALHRLFALSLFFRRFRLLVNVRISAVIVAGIVVRGRFTAKVTIDALIIDVILASDVFGISIRDVSHKNRNSGVVWSWKHKYQASIDESRRVPSLRLNSGEI